MHGHHVFIIVLIALFCGAADECNIGREVGRSGDDAGPTEDSGPTDDGGPVEEDADVPVDEDAGVIEGAPVVFITAMENAISVQFGENVEHESVCNGDVSWTLIDSFGPCEIFSAYPCSETETLPDVEVFDLGPDAVTVSYGGSPPIAVEYAEWGYTHIFPEPQLAGSEVTVTITIPELPTIERTITLTSIDFERPEAYGDIYPTADHDMGEDLIVEWDVTSGGYGEVMFDMWSNDAVEEYPFYDVRCMGTYEDGGFTIPWSVVDTYSMSIGDWGPSITIVNFIFSEEIVDGVKVIESISSVDLGATLYLVDPEFP